MKHLLIRATQRPLKVIKVDGYTIPFGKDGSVTITDSGLAREVDARFGRKGTSEVAVAPIHSSDRRPTFLVPALPWKKEK